MAETSGRDERWTLEAVDIRQGDGQLDKMDIRQGDGQLDKMDIRQDDGQLDKVVDKVTDKVMYIRQGGGHWTRRRTGDVH